jgi:S-adenosylmethionine/arginine decarboxylase-like enzyme
MENKVLVHKHLIVRAEIKKPPQSESYFEDWLRDFIESIEMKILMGPFVKYSDMPGNEGLTGGAIIETSHVIMHCWDRVEPPIMQLDVYSCSEFDPIKVCDKVKKDFDATKIEYKFLDRENDLREIHTISFSDDMISRNYENKEIERKNNILMKSRKEVEINGNGTSGYRIKEGIHKGTVLGHIIREKSGLEN